MRCVLITSAFTHLYHLVCLLVIKQAQILVSFASTFNVVRWLSFHQSSQLSASVDVGRICASSSCFEIWKKSFQELRDGAPAIRKTLRPKLPWNIFVKTILRSTIVWSHASVLSFETRSKLVKTYHCFAQFFRLWEQSWWFFKYHFVMADQKCWQNWFTKLWADCEVHKALSL